MLKGCPDLANVRNNFAVDLFKYLLAVNKKRRLTLNIWGFYERFFSE